MSAENVAENGLVALSVPKSLGRVALEVEGWLELQNPSLALARVEPLLKAPGARAAGLYLQTKALVELGRFAEALTCIEALRSFEQDPDWLDLTEAWCLKRMSRLQEAVACMERMIARCHHSAIGHYNLACYLALLGRRERAIDEVTLACGLEASFRRRAVDESDFDSLRGDPRFDQLLLSS